MVSYVPFLWTAQITGTKGSILPLCNNTVFRLRMEDSMNIRHSSELHLMLIAAIRYATFLQTLSLLFLWILDQNIFGWSDILPLSQCHDPLLKFRRQEFRFFLRQCSVSDEVSKFLLCELVLFNKVYVRKKFKISWNRWLSCSFGRPLSVHSFLCNPFRNGEIRVNFKYLMYFSCSAPQNYLRWSTFSSFCECCTV